MPGHFRSVAGEWNPSFDDVIAEATENDTPLQKWHSAWTELSFKFSEAIAGKGKAFSDGEIVFEKYSHIRKFAS